MKIVPAGKRRANYAARVFLMQAAVLLLALAAGGASAAETSGRASTVQPADIEAFVREGCPHCARAEAFLVTLAQQRPELKIVIRDVLKDPAALDRLKHLAGPQVGNSLRVPAFAVGGQLIIGFSEEANTARLILDSLDPASAPLFDSTTFELDFLGYHLSPERLGLPLFTLAMGLLDGFNPCSMWVLILMISLLAPMHNRPRMLAIGGTFVAVQGIAYFVFMAAWLNLFLLIGLSRVSEIIIAVLALLAGAINLKDFWRYGWGISLSIPDTRKPGIYARMRRILAARSLAAAILGVFILAILVQIIELMCTSGLPALYTRILTMQQLDSLGYYAYLALYDLAYMVDDVIVLSIGVVTLSQRRLQEKEGRWLKLISGLVMVGLGVYLLFMAP